MASLPKSGPVPLSNGPGRLFIVVGRGDVALKVGSQRKRWKNGSAVKIRTVLVISVAKGGFPDRLLGAGARLG